MVLNYTVQQVSSTTNLSTFIDTVFITAADATVNINLPAIAANGQRYLMKRVDSTDNGVYIIPNGSDTVGGSSSQFISNGQVIELVSFDGNWEYTQNLAL